MVWKCWASHITQDHDKPFTLKTKQGSSGGSGGDEEEEEEEKEEYRFFLGKALR